MNKLFLTLLLVPFTSFAGVSCLGHYLISSEGYGMHGYFSNVGEDTCPKALEKSKNGFVCIGSHLVGGHTIESIAILGSKADCQKAIDISKNGFTCINGALYGAGERPKKETLASQEDCLKVLSMSISY